MIWQNGCSIELDRNHQSSCCRKSCFSRNYVGYLIHPLSLSNPKRAGALPTYRVIASLSFIFIQNINIRTLTSLTNCSDKAMRETLQKIYSCSYFTKSDESAEVESSASAPEEQVDEPEQQPEPIACSEVI